MRTVSQIVNLKRLLFVLLLMAIQRQLHAQYKGVKEVYIIHNTHCDYGYTDYPETSINQHVDFLRMAIQYCADTERYPADARFHWTIENVWTLENFWKTATPEEKREFDKYYALGQIELTAMPANFTMLPQQELENEINRLSFFYKKYKPVTVMQNDVNGIPWGMIPMFKKNGFKYIWMGLNNYGSKAPKPVPSYWIWEGPGQSSIYTWMAYKYSDGYDWFHREWWRRGPVATAHNVWFNPPTGKETFDDSPANLDSAALFVNAFIQKLQKADYPFDKVAISVTNMWRCDNDPPQRQLSEFIKAWNASGRTPRLIFSTPAKFFSKLTATQPATGLDIVRGDWSDWWADGLASMPAQIATLLDARRRHADNANVFASLPVKNNTMQRELQENNRNILYCMEHSFDSYNSVAYPYGEVTQNNEYHRYNEIYRAQESSKLIKADIIRQLPQYCSFSQTRNIEVFNPGKETRSAWVHLSADALRFRANAVRDVNTGMVFPLDTIKGYEWSEPRKDAHRPLEFPDNVWGSVPQELTFFVQALKPGEKRKYELVYEPELIKAPKAAAGFIRDENGYRPFKNVSLNGNEVFDPASDYFPGQIVLEKSPRFKDRYYIENRLADARFERVLPEVISRRYESGHYSEKVIISYKTDIAKSIVQEFELPAGSSRMNIVTTIWLNEVTDPTAMYMAFPMANVSPAPFYYSNGYATRVGSNQMPNSCGEFSVVQDGVWYESEKYRVVLHSPDNPIMGFEDIYTRRFRDVFEPQKSIAFSMLMNNYWVTNFPILKPTKLVLRHSVELVEKEKPISFQSGGELWVYPVK